MKHHLAEREIASQKYYIDLTAGDHERLFLALRTQRSELPMLPRSYDSCPRFEERVGPRSSDVLGA